jgi:DNA helicase-2/ATP-dependent DNA helicase PcrA
VDVLTTLNPQQSLSVEHPGGPVLVIAGAGSGKTRVLTARVSWLLGRGVPPSAVLAFTFTNRAAREMRARIEREVGPAASDVWIGTFHGTAVRLLRREAAAAGLPRDFVIYDREDQESVLRDVLRAIELPENGVKPSAVLARISDAKNQLVTPEELAAAATGPYARRIAEVYAGYQAVLRANGALDFDDLISESVRLLEQRPEVGERYRRRFEHVLVDEYQDTNHAQFRFVAALAAGHRNLFVVGDDDQSIYGWRGASLANVLEFEQAFPGAAVIRLEQNYRSTGNILSAANAVIANNRSRKGKTLWCEREAGGRLRFVLAMDETDEARRIRAILEGHVRRGGSLRDFAVLYRTNAQSRSIETDLRLAGLPYEIVGGVSFFLRREVKDMLAYLRLVVNPSDTVSFWRVWNTPRRGLGSVVEAKVTARAGATNASPLEALETLVEAGELGRAALAGAREFLDLLAELRAMQHEPVDRVMGRLLERSRYLEHLEGDEDSSDRKANVQELIASAEGYANSGGTLAEFLGEAALITDMDRVAEDADRVLLLTAHNAKGLEFPHVIVAGLEEGLFPHGNALEEPSELEEERRLFYVAITRAQHSVTLTAAAFRRRFDGARGGSVSRFVNEIPPELLDRDEGAVGMRRPAEDTGRGARPWRGRRDDSDHDALVSAGGFTRAPAWAQRALGRRVYHESFGRGVVVAAEGAGDDVKYTVRFREGTKKVLGRFLTGGTDGDEA